MGRVLLVVGQLIVFQAAHREGACRDFDETEKGLGSVAVTLRQMKDLCVEARIAEAAEDIAGLKALARHQSVFFDGDDQPAAGALQECLVMPFTRRLFGKA